MDTVRIGLVGAGGMGKVHYANIQQLEGAEVVAVVGKSDRVRKTAAEWGIPCYESVSDMVKGTELDMIDVCTPTYTHHDAVIEALRCGKDTICEKPIALSYADAAEMFDEAEKNGVHLYIAQVLQFTKEIEALHSVTESGELGKPLDAVFERLSACPGWTADGWLFDGKKSGLLYYDLHIHDLDVIVSVFGKPDSFTISSCRGEGKSYPEQIRVDYSYGGHHVIGEAAWFNAPIPWTARLIVYYENVMLINDGSSLTMYRFGSEPYVFDTADEVMVSTGINVPPCGWYYNELKEFVRCHREGIDCGRVGREQLLAVMELLEEMKKR